MKIKNKFIIGVATFLSMGVLLASPVKAGIDEDEAARLGFATVEEYRVARDEAAKFGMTGLAGIAEYRQLRAEAARFDITSAEASSIGMTLISHTKIAAYHSLRNYAEKVRMSVDEFRIVLAEANRLDMRMVSHSDVDTFLRLRAEANRLDMDIMQYSRFRDEAFLKGISFKDYVTSPQRFVMHPELI